MVNVQFEADNLNINVQVREDLRKHLEINPLNRSIKPDKSSYRVSRNKLTIALVKEDYVSWGNLIKQPTK